ncbi:MAG: sigma-70 family RNA polymerase sigma factor [Acidobacteria bacterium]|nr:sigma-70 family RNA polymerase sigma factor [Acidobacteriota bacterium]
MTVSSETAAEELSLEELLEKTKPQMRQVLYRYRIPQQDAEDLVQQTMLTLVYKRAQVEKPEPWLIATLRNRCIMYWRSRRSQLFETFDTAILELMATPSEGGQQERALHHDLQRAVDRLPERCRRILHLRYGLGYGPSEVAEKLGYQPSSIRKVTNRCLAALSKQLIVSGFSRLDDFEP